MEVIMFRKNNNTNNHDKLLMKKANLSTNNEQGFIKIRVSTGLGKLPLSGAKVTVYVALDELVPIQTVTSDEMGNCPIITLPVYYNPEIKEMDPIYFYTNYIFSVNFNNYYPVATYSVQVFPGITTEFDVNMNPVPAIDPFTNREQQTVIPRIDL
jgi:hypothetical protein